MKDIKKELNTKLDPKYVLTREQSGVKLSYVEGHHVIREANRIFGWDGWSKYTNSLTVVQEELKKDDRGGEKWYVGYVCEGLVSVDGDNVGSKQSYDVGFGQGIDRDKGRAHESAVKEAVTDMMKRCLKDFGDPFGLALYDKQKEHVGTSEQFTMPKSDVNAAKAKVTKLVGDKDKAKQVWAQMTGTDEEKAAQVFLANTLDDLKCKA